MRKKNKKFPEYSNFSFCLINLTMKIINIIFKFLILLLKGEQDEREGGERGREGERIKIETLKMLHNVIHATETNSSPQITSKKCLCPKCKREREEKEISHTIESHVRLFFLSFFLVTMQIEGIFYLFPAFLLLSLFCP